MIPIIKILVILTIHWIADFLCQNRWMAMNKSKAWIPLIAHTGTYTAVTIAGWMLTGITWGVPYVKVAQMVIITFTTHTIIDYFTSRVQASYWRQEKYMQFFTSIGFDQLLHYIQLFVMYYFLVAR